MLADVVKALLSLGMYIADSLGHSEDDLKAEVSRQLAEELPSKAAYQRYLDMLTPGTNPAPKSSG